MAPPPTDAFRTEFDRKTQFVQTTLLPAPIFKPPPAPELPTALKRKEQLVRRGDPSVTRSPPPWLLAKLKVNLRLASVGAPPLIAMPAPRSSGSAPSAWPPVIVKPSSTPESVTAPSAVTTW